jgi:membrane-associated protease RseP (regulator of RpoE activity)
MQLSALLGGIVRRTWLVTLVAVVTCAAFAARAVAAAPSAPPPARKAAPPATVQIDGRVLVDRNIFCSECLPASPTAEQGATEAPYSGLPVVLIATSLGEEASATLHVPSTGAQGSWSLGDTVPGVGSIARIGPTYIDVVDANHKSGRISLLDAAAGRSGPGAATPRTAAPAAPRPFADRINKINDTTFEVERGLVRELVTGVSNGGGVRAFPVMENGEIKGLRLAGVKPGSVAAELGMRSGDLVNSIDGEPIKNVQQLLDLYAKIDNLNGVELGLVRATKPVALSLRLR